MMPRAFVLTVASLCLAAGSAKAQFAPSTTPGNSAINVTGAGTGASAPSTLQPAGNGISNPNAMVPSGAAMSPATPALSPGLSNTGIGLTGAVVPPPAARARRPVPATTPH